MSVKIVNKTDLRGRDLRKLVEAALERAHSFRRVKEVTFIIVPRGKTIDTSRSYRSVFVSIPKTCQKPEGLLGLAGSLGGHLYWRFYEMKWGESPRRIDWEWGKEFLLRLKLSAAKEKPKRPAALVREDRARKRLESLERQLAALEKKKKRLQTSLKTARARVKYYDKRLSKAAQEEDFRKRLQTKVAGLLHEDNE